jgi:hypothetical protein
LVRIVIGYCDVEEKRLSAGRENALNHRREC